MDFLLQVLKPLFLPILKLDFTPPHLPEGSALVRTLKPSDKWLAYRSLTTLFGFFNQFIGLGIGLVAFVAKVGKWGLVLAAVALAIEFFVIGLALVTTRVDFELRHYLVGDRSLRVVQGAWRREEVTLSYANVQNLEVSQGPIERLFGFKSLTLSTAGAEQHQPGTENSHVVTLVGLEDAEAVRSLILGMLKQHRDTGLGDPEKPVAPGLSLARLEEVKQAAFALREAASGKSPQPLTR